MASPVKPELSIFCFLLSSRVSLGKGISGRGPSYLGYPGHVLSRGRDALSRVLLGDLAAVATLPEAGWSAEP